MSFCDALNEAKAASRTRDREKTRRGRTSACAQKTTASQSRKAEEVEDGRGRTSYARSLDFSDHGDVARLVRRRALILSICSMSTCLGFGNLWRWMQLRQRHGRGHPTLCISPPISTFELSTLIVTLQLTACPTAPVLFGFFVFVSPYLG
jgi:hypothetical protein